MGCKIYTRHGINILFTLNQFISLIPNTGYRLNVLFHGYPEMLLRL